MRTIIIAFGYKSQHGKDTAAKAIKQARGDKYNIVLYPFARPMKIDVYNALLNPQDPLWKTVERVSNGAVFYHNVLIPKPTNPFVSDDEKFNWVEEHKPALRQILQWCGTEHRRAVDPFYWVRKTAEAIAKDKPQFAFITDLRFINEAFFVKANDGYTVKVERHGYVNEVAEAHASEHQLKDYGFDATITVLDGEVEQLKKDAVEFFDMVCTWCSVPEYTTADFTEEGMNAQLVSGRP